jgi:hypothetical protein
MKTLKTIRLLPDILGSALEWNYESMYYVVGCMYILHVSLIIWRPLSISMERSDTLTIMDSSTAKSQDDGSPASLVPCFQFQFRIRLANFLSLLFAGWERWLLSFWPDAFSLRSCHLIYFTRTLKLDPWIEIFVQKNKFVILRTNGGRWDDKQEQQWVEMPIFAC